MSEHTAPAVEVPLAVEVPAGRDAPAGSEPAAVRSWQDKLDSLVGMPPGERAALLEQLGAFCAVRGIDPDTLLRTWQRYPELTARRRHEPGGAHAAVESFLVHNGVNIFGDIVCMPGRPEDLAEQGARFVPTPGE